METTKNSIARVTVIYNGAAVEVTCEVAEFLEECRLEDRRQSEKIRRHQSDRECAESYIEEYMRESPRGFEDELIDKLTMEELPDALAKLPEIQRRRVRAYYYEGLTYREIAAREGVNHTKIAKSVDATLGNLKKYFGAGGTNAV